jgi:hypothetical protein
MMHDDGVLLVIARGRARVLQRAIQCPAGAPPLLHDTTQKSQSCAAICCSHNNHHHLARHTAQFSMALHTQVSQQNTAPLPTPHNTTTARASTARFRPVGGALLRRQGWAPHNDAHAHTFTCQMARLARRHRQSRRLRAQWHAIQQRLCCAVAVSPLPSLVATVDTMHGHRR